MYDGVSTEFVNTGIIVELKESQWMDRGGNIRNEKDTFGCKVTHDINNPGYITVIDKVGGNTSQKVNSHLGGELMSCETSTTPAHKIHTKNNHYTVLGLTTLSSKYVVCYIIFAGIKENYLCKTSL